MASAAAYRKAARMRSDFVGITVVAVELEKAPAARFENVDCCTPPAAVTEPPLYPLRFQPIYQYRPWGGRRLASLMSAPLPDHDPIGEAWLLSDRVDYPSRVADGPLEGRTLGQLLAQASEQMLGTLAGRFARFPLLLKFLDVHARLSVQVHPSDDQTGGARAGNGDGGKTEAWVVLETSPDSRVYAGLKSGTTEPGLRQVIVDGTVADTLASFIPKPGDGVLVPAGTVHSLRDTMVFEVQQNSDITYRLYDWDRVDPKTGHLRDLQVDRALDCINFSQVPIRPIEPVVEKLTPVLRERIVVCRQFGVWRWHAQAPFLLRALATAHVLVCIEGDGSLEHNGVEYLFGRGDVLLLPAIVGACLCRPRPAVTVLDITLPDGT
jgi:mannose-6-phosphate isomerase